MFRSDKESIDAAFIQIQGTGPQLAAVKNPIKTSIERINVITRSLGILTGNDFEFYEQVEMEFSA